MGLKRFTVNYNSVVIAILLLVIGSFFVNRFPQNIPTILVEMSVYGFVAIGLAFVMISGEIDLSVGYMAGSAAVVVVLIVSAGGSIALAALSALGVGALLGALNGFAVTRLGIDSLIATIATNYIFTGFVYIFTHNGAIYPEGALRTALKESLAGNMLFGQKFLTLTVVIMALVLVSFAFFMRKTRFGVSLYVIGDNAEAGALAGISITRTKFLAFVICGVCCAVAGIFLASYAGAALFTQGEGRNVFAISACVIGGIKMAGGKGTMLSVLLGILIMRIISTVMNLLLVPSAWVDFISGALLLAVLAIDRFTSAKIADD